MGEEDADSSVDRSTWEWIPNERYGPFVFGQRRDDVPLLGERIDVQQIGDDVVSDWSTAFDGVVATFWNDVLTGIEISNASFHVGDTDLIGLSLHGIRERFAHHSPVLDTAATRWVMEVDELSLMIFFDEQQQVDTVAVDVDPASVLPD